MVPTTNINILEVLYDLQTQKGAVTSLFECLAQLGAYAYRNHTAGSDRADSHPPPVSSAMRNNAMNTGAGVGLAAVMESVVIPTR